MKKAILLLTACVAVFAGQCDKKINQIQKEIEFAKIHGNTHRVDHLEIALKEVQSKCSKDGSYYDKRLEAKQLKDQEVKKIEQELKELQNQKDSMSKKEYKARKEQLKQKKDSAKREAKKYIDNL